MSCAAAGDCASGQVCGTDGFCAAPNVSCDSGGTDGGVPIRDGHLVDAESIAPIDAPPDAPDAPPTTSLHVHLDGQGSVTIVGVGTCGQADPQKGDCTFPVVTNIPLVANASPYNDWRFDKWTSSNCAMESTQTCTFAAHGAMTSLTLKFRRMD